MTHDIQDTPERTDERTLPRRKRKRRFGREANPTVLPDLTTVSDAEVVDNYEKGHEEKARSIGRNPSPARVEDYAYPRFRELAREAEYLAGAGRGGLPEEEYERLRAQAAAELEQAAELSERDQQLMREWQQSSTVDIEPDRESEAPVIAAVLSLKHIAWMMLKLACRTGGRGPAPKRRLSAAVIVHMAFARRRPEIADSRKDFMGAQALINWAYNYPNDPDVEAVQPMNRFYDAVHETLHPDNLDPRLAEHIQVETFKQFAAQVATDENGEPITDRNGRAVLKHPKAGLALVADGSFVEGQVQQGPPIDDDHLLVRVRRRADRDGIRFVTYNRRGNFVSSVVGYKLIALIDVATGRCVISTVTPANVHEPDAVIYLLERLYKLWPGCPAQFLVGDGLYGHGKDFLRELMFRFGLDPVFPWRADYRENKEETMRGVPICNCLEGTPRPMVFKQRKGKWWGHAQRVAGTLPHGRWVPEEAKKLRFEFTCPDGRCQNKTTSAWKHPGIYSYLPHTGDTNQASLRRVLLRQRNVVESHYSALQRLGLQGEGADRPQWANDIEAHWLLALGSTFLTARRLVFENGLYERAAAEAASLHLLDNPGRRNPAPGPNARELALATAQRVREIGLPEPPESWLRECGGSIEPLTGSAEVWLNEFACAESALADSSGLAEAA
jgi:hypothetical protein